MRLFEAGIYSKLTEDEYLKLRQNQDGSLDNRMVSEGANEVEGMQTHLKAMSMKTLQGAFYVLIIGYLFSGKCDLLKLLSLNLETYIFNRAGS